MRQKNKKKNGLKKANTFGFIFSKRCERGISDLQMQFIITKAVFMYKESKRGDENKTLNTLTSIVVKKQKTNKLPDQCICYIEDNCSTTTLPQS